MPRTFFVGGNFKMEGTLSSLKSLIANLTGAVLDPTVEVVVSPPSLYLLPVLDQVQKSGNAQVKVAAQNAYHEEKGAFTGEVSVSQLKDVGLEYVILGHSERRTLFGESSSFIGTKTSIASNAPYNLTVILCIGETLSERESSQTSTVVRSQLDAVLSSKPAPNWKNIVIAYEPVWAIGTGKVATKEQAQEVHKDIREWVKEKVGKKESEEIRIIYGGSVKAANCKELAGQEDIDGFLVGGASLKPEFVEIVNARKGTKH